MVFRNLLDGEQSHSGPLFGPFESMRGGTLGTNNHHIENFVLAVHFYVVK
jgi:hypothetical protein